MEGSIRLVVSGATGKPRGPKEVTTIVGTGTPLDFRVFNTSVNNLLVGIHERLFFVRVDGQLQRPPKPLTNVYLERLDYIAAALAKHVPMSTPMEREHFPLLYQARRRTIYANAVESLLTTPVNRRDAECKTFTKVEKVNFSTKVPVPRIIQPRDPRYNVEVGIYIKPLEALLCKSVSRLFGSVTIVKGLNANQVGELAHHKWTRFRRPVAISLDATRFDQHVSVQALRWEHSVYLRCFKRQSDRDRLRRLLEWQIVNRGRTFIEDRKIKYTVEGCRMSGDMNTGLGNCLIASSIIYAYFQHVGVRFELLNNGDDCCVMVEQDDLHVVSGIKEWFLDFGFQVVLEEPSYDLEKIEFCQSCFINIGGSYRMIRKPMVAVAKDSISLKPLDHDKLYRNWLYSVGEGGLALNSGVPVLQEFYMAYMRSGISNERLNLDPTFETGTRMLTIGMDSKFQNVTPEARYSFWLATGILPDMQVWLERQYASKTYSFDSIGCNVDYSLYYSG